MNRAVISVATGHYQVGQARLSAALDVIAPECIKYLIPMIPPRYPSHADKPYAFKAYALHEIEQSSATQLLWADACIIPVRSLEPIWQHAKEHGVWMCSNYGYRNSTWTADSAYRYLFPGVFASSGPEAPLPRAQRINDGIPHAIATAFALDLEHPKGRAFLDEYYRLASETRAFCGPWTNGPATPDGRTAPCGPPDVKGHRHDQTAASVIAWRLGIKLEEPRMFSYKGGETGETILVADGGY